MASRPPWPERPIRRGHRTAGIAHFCVREAERQVAFNLRFLEQRYRSAGMSFATACRQMLLCFRFGTAARCDFTETEALSWAGLDPRGSIEGWHGSRAHGRPPYILLESWEEPAIDPSGHSDIGKLDWPPKYEIDARTGSMIP